MRYLALEENLNLLSGGELKRIALQAGLDAPVVVGVPLGGWPSNLLLFARRKA
jgi:hypothetical protein